LEIAAPFRVDAHRHHELVLFLRPPAGGAGHQLRAQHRVRLPEAPRHEVQDAHPDLEDRQRQHDAEAGQERDGEHSAADRRPCHVPLHVRVLVPVRVHVLSYTHGHADPFAYAYVYEYVYGGPSRTMVTRVAATPLAPPP